MKKNGRRCTGITNTIGIKTIMTEDKPKTPTYDARQRYYDVMLGCVRKGVDALREGDLLAWYFELKTLQAMVHNWISKENQNKLENVLDEVYKEILTLSSVPVHHAWGASAARKKRVRAVSMSLDALRLIMGAASHMMLPAGEVDMEVDIETLVQGLDL